MCVCVCVCVLRIVSVDKIWWFTNTLIFIILFLFVAQEYSKIVFQSEDTDHQKAVRQILYMVTDTFLRALSPFMPFLTEELFQRLPAKGSNWPESVCIAPYPQPQDVRMCLVVSLRELEDVFWGLFLDIKASLYCSHVFS